MQIIGIKELEATLDNIRKVRLRKATATAINDLLYYVSEDEKKEMTDVFDRPTPAVLRGTRMTRATTSDLTGTFKLADDRDKGLNVAKILRPHIVGGDRLVKASERRLRRFGFMWPDQYIVPGPGVTLDQYGNVSGQTMTRILSQIQAFSESGYTANAKIKRANSRRTIGYLGEIFPIRGVGIFMRTGWTGRGARGSGMKNSYQHAVPLLFFTNKKPEYEAGRFDFQFVADLTTQKNYREIFGKAWRATAS